MPAPRAAAVAAAAFSRLCPPGSPGSAGRASSTENSTWRARPGTRRNARGLAEWVSAGGAGTLVGDVRPGEQRCVFVVPELAVDAHDLDAVALQERSGRLPGARHPEDDGAFHGRRTRLSSTRSPSP